MTCCGIVRKTMRFKFVLVFVALALASKATADTRNSLEMLCRLKKDAPRVIRVAEVREMIKMLKEDQVACETKTSDAIKALEPVVQLQSVCSEEAADKMVAFWKDYVRTKADGRKHLPKQLRKFFIAYGLQMSKLCKATMIGQLAAATGANQITNDDIQLVTERLNGFIGKLFSERRVENLLAIVQAYKREENEENTTRVNVEPLRKEILDRIRERCAKKFKPVYDTLITPIVRLAAIGLNYKGDSIDEKMKEFYENQLYKDWFAAVIACETASMFVPISVPKLSADTAGNKKLITFLDENDFAELRMRGLAEKEPAIEAPADYSVQVSLDDLIIDENDTNLMRLMKNYGGMLKDSNKFRMRMMKKAPYLLKTYADRKAVQFGLHPSKKSRFGRVVDPNEKRSAAIFILSTTFWACVLTGGMIAAIFLTHGWFLALIIIVGGIAFLALCDMIKNTVNEYFI